MPELESTPATGLTDCHVRFAGFDTIKGQGGAATLRFEFHGKDEKPIGELMITVGPQEAGTVDAMIAEGYRTLNDVLRQWMAEAATGYKAYVGRVPTGASGT